MNKENLEKMSSLVFLEKSTQEEIKKMIEGMKLDNLKVIQDVVNSNKFPKIIIPESVLKLSDIFNSLPRPFFTKEEVNILEKNIKIMADKGWVIYLGELNIYRRLLDLKNIKNIEMELIEVTRESLLNNTIIEELKTYKGYSEVLVTSMLDSYSTKNYYAAYTLATIAIDGVLNRISELLDYKKLEKYNPRRKIKVGYKAVKEFETYVINKTLVSVSLISWLNKFFSDTKGFTLEEPNRHMITHGRWNKEINEIQFLQLVNVMMSIIIFEDVI